MAVAIEVGASVVMWNVGVTTDGEGRAPEESPLVHPMQVITRINAWKKAIRLMQDYR